MNVEQIAKVAHEMTDRRASEAGKRFIVQAAARQRVVGRFVPRRSRPFSAVESIAGAVHHLASHSPLAPKWRNVEKKLLARYAPNLYTMIKLGIKRERL